MKEMTNFMGRIVSQTVESNKLILGSKIRSLVIADLHGYTNDLERAKRLANALMILEPDIIFIAGDLFNGGKPWEGGKKLESFEKFIEMISKVAPVCITWGNHDIRSLSPKYEEIRLRNFYNLEKKRPGNVYPLYNDKVIVKGMEVIGYVPRLDLVELDGIKKQDHGLAHDEFIVDYHNEGVKFDNIPGLLNVYLGHDPQLIAVSENGIGLEDLSVCDYFVTGHRHNGYKDLLTPLDNFKRKLTGKGLKALELDGGYTELPFGVLDHLGHHIRGTRRILGPTRLCRGIIYIDNDAQQRYLQMPDNNFYVKVNENWQAIDENEARKDILDNNLHFMVVSEGIAPSFYPKEELATINVVDIEGKKLTKKIGSI